MCLAVLMRLDKIEGKIGIVELDGLQIQGGLDWVDHSETGGVIWGAVSRKEDSPFGTSCLPESPMDACLVAEEGTCAAPYKYRAAHIGDQPE